MKDELFEELRQSVREGGAFLGGRRKPSRALTPRGVRRQGRSQDLPPKPVEIGCPNGHKQFFEDFRE